MASMIVVLPRTGAAGNRQDLGPRGYADGLLLLPLPALS